MKGFWTLGAENLILVAALWFNRRGEIQLATKIVCFSELGCVLLLTSVIGGGFKDEGMLLFPLIVVIAAILLDWNSYIRFASLVMVSVAGSGFIQSAIGTWDNQTTYHRVANVLNILLVTVVAVGLLARNLKRSAVQSHEAERGMRALSARLIDAQEEERTRIARELHDDLSQQIAALSIGMGILKRQILTQPADAVPQSDRIQQKLVAVSESIRRLSHELHPAVLEHSGLAAALRTYCSEFGLLTGVRVSFQESGSFEGIPIAVSLCVYRITQEALQNVAKHAKVAEAGVELERADGALRLSVSDRGVGIAPGRSALPGGLGLVSLKERALLVNGALEIQSQPNQGTNIRLTVPV